MNEHALEFHLQVNLVIYSLDIDELLLPSISSSLSITAGVYLGVYSAMPKKVSRCILKVFLPEVYIATFGWDLRYYTHSEKSVAPHNCHNSAAHCEHISYS